jgi:opine dehydrogenase
VDKSRFVILGGGNGGQSLAGDLAERGFHVAALYNRFPQAIEPVARKGGVELVGPVRSGFGKIDLVTSDMGEAVRSGDVLFVVVPAFAHEWIAEQVAPHLQDGQIIVLTPGYFGGTLLFRKILHERGVDAKVTLAEVPSLPYATRIIGPAQVGIKGTKKSLLLAALPATETDRVFNRLKMALPVLVPTDNVLVVGLANPNPLSHVPAYLLNLGRIGTDMPSGHFDWHDWVTPEIKRVQSALDGERRLVSQALGVRCYTREELSQMHYAGEAWKIIQPTGEIPKSAQTIPERFITEDVPMGLVPIASLGDMLGVDTPVTHSLITIASTFMAQDFWAEGRTVEKLGLAGMTPEEIGSLVGQLEYALPALQ